MTTNGQEATDHMYLNFYNLKKEPFQITPDPEFLFLSTSHREALASIMYGVDQRKGFITITGEVGVGKTSVLRYYLEQVDKENIKTVYIFNPNVSFGGLLKTIFQKMGFDPKTEDPTEMVNDFHLILIDRYKQGRNMALIIDEAQNMPIETLENLRMLSNLETSKEKLVQIVLVGQPEFEETLKRQELRQLKQRIAIKTTIVPLTKEECRAYIQHRLTKASLNGSKVFTQSALRKIIAESQGIPRLINVLCDNALITGYGYQKKCITGRVADEVIADFKGGRAPALFTPVEVGFFAAVALLFLAGALSLYLHGRNFLSTLDSVPQISQQERHVPHAPGQRGASLSGAITGIAGESKPPVKKEVKGDR
jgi:general secretion pathway protein A